MIVVPLPRLVFPGLIITVLLLSFAARLYKLSSVPSVVSHDEIYYMVEAKTISLTGRDPSGLWQPSSLIPANTLFAELPGTIMSLAARLIPQNPLLAGRVTSAVMGTLLPLLLAGVVFELSKNKRLFLITFLIATVNPWIFQFSRMSFDSLFSLFFYFTGFYLLLRLTGFWKLLAAIPFILGFYQYQGLKVVFLPFVLIAALAVILQSNKNLFSKKLLPIWLFLLILSIFFVSQVIRITNQAAGERTNDIIFAHRADFRLAAGVQQQQSIENIFQKTFVNSYTMMARSAAQAYLGSFNPQQLFVNGEARRNPFSVWSLGILYLIDAPLLVFGLLALWREKRHKVLAITISLLILLGPLPSALQTNDIWIMFRSSLLFISLVLLSGYGLYAVTKLNRIFAIAIVALYVIFVTQFFYEYFFRYPIYGTEGKYFAERVLGEYVRRLPKSQKINVYADEKYFVFLEILLSANLITQDSVQQLQEAMQSGIYSLSNVRVDTTCFPVGIDWNSTTAVKDSSTAPCEGEQDVEQMKSLPKSAIASLLDSGAVFTLYNDQLCAQYSLGGSLFVRTDVFDFSKLSDEAFCRSFFITSEKE
ncbi:MAG: hypothetical protein COU68_00175 [Candidatus Pacebacteria bacterium CG10_big_fil_rev_8_21_14_0_10_45_6]|nr:MAG: hypothetical protein COU68_00175 [Candidatus Pacebacteria bacterium CG10_big_fil_rev_8_21_14_0_10_45_6]